MRSKRVRKSHTFKNTKKVNSRQKRKCTSARLKPFLLSMKNTKYGHMTLDYEINGRTGEGNTSVVVFLMWR